MPLATQIAGLLAAGALAVAMGRALGLTGRSAFALVAVVPIVVASVVGVPAFRGAVDSLLGQRAGHAPLTADQARVSGGLAQGVDVDFLEWARRRIPPDDTFHLLRPESPNVAAIRQWTLFQLAPRLAVKRAEDADWLVGYDRPAGEGYRARGFERPRRYSPGFFVAGRASAR